MLGLCQARIEVRLPSGRAQASTSHDENLNMNHRKMWTDALALLCLVIGDFQLGIMIHRAPSMHVILYYQPMEMSTEVGRGSQDCVMENSLTFVQ